MELPVLRMSFDDRAALVRELDQNLSRGRAFVKQASPAVEIPVLSECVLVLVHPDDGRELQLPAQVVMISTSGSMCGVGLALTRLRDTELAELGAFAAGAPVREPSKADAPPIRPGASAHSQEPGPDTATAVQLREWQAAPPLAADEVITAVAEGAPEADLPTAQVDIEAGASLTPAEPDTAKVPIPPELLQQHAEPDSTPDTASAPLPTEPPLTATERTRSSEIQASNPREKLRHLNATQQLKVARTGELAERVAVERMYGKHVWEALLRNPRLSIPEVASIARKGTVPKPLLDVILDNPAWIKADAVRRALLNNPKLSAEAILKLLRATPKHELKLIEKGTAYGQAVRESARKLLRQP